MKAKNSAKCIPRTAVAYARYSSAGQRDVSIDQQLQDIRAYASREGYTIVREYADHARSGFKDASTRAEFQRMIASAPSGSFDTVLCWKVDRFGRNRADSATYKSQLARLGVSVVYVMEPIPDGAAGVLTEGMLEAIAEWYSRNLSENVIRGMTDNARKALYNGDHVYGYAPGLDQRYQVVDNQAAVVRRIFSLYCSGYSYAQICADLNGSGLRTARGNPWRIGVVMNIIKNERYTGIYLWGDIRIPGGMPAIIDQHTFEEAQLMRQKTSRHVERHPYDFLLTGKAFCGHCGRSMVGDSGTSKTGTTYYYYTCQGHKSRTGCKKKSIRKEMLENLVISYIYDHCLTDDQILRIADIVMEEMKKRKEKSPLASMKKELEEVTKKINNINNAIANGIWNPSTSQLLSDLEEQQHNLQSDIDLLEYTESQLLDRDRVLFFLYRFKKLDRNNPADRKTLVNYFINAVYVYDDHLKLLVNTAEGTTQIPLQELPDDPLCSDIIQDGLPLCTHPNPVIVYAVRI